MCLQRILRDEQVPKSGVGYKVFVKDYQNKYSYCVCRTPKTFGIGEKLQNTYKIRIRAGWTADAYFTGFHVFLNLEDAKKYYARLKSDYKYCSIAIVQVSFGKGRVLGEDIHGEKCVVADEITLLEEICV